MAFSRILTILAASVGATAVGLGPMRGAPQEDLPSPAGSSQRPPEAMPRWLRLSGEIRARLEHPTGLSFSPQQDDLELLTRLRLAIRVMPSGWFRLTTEFQDAHAPGWNPPVPGSVSDRLDLRLAFFEIGSFEGAGWGLRAGRQPLKFGRGRLVWDPDWSNTGRAFDALRIGLGHSSRRIDLFAASPVQPQDRRFDRADFGHMLYGAYGAIHAGRNLDMEPYLLLKRVASYRSELNQAGSLDLYTTGWRICTQFGGNKSLEMELVLQRGRAAGGPVRAWADVWQASWPTGKARIAPRVSIGYSYASGDSNPRDGIRETFDVLYPTTHLRNGATDRIGWANLHDWTLQAGWAAGNDFRITVSTHDFRLATVKDALYSPSGVPVMRNPNARTAHVGSEIAATAEYQPSGRVTLGASVAHLFPGVFLLRSGRGGATQPYAFLAYRY